MKKAINGFTIIELMVVISVIGVLTTIGFVSFATIQSNARDSIRSSQITIIAEELENFYDKNGEYPSCNAMAADPDTVVTNTLIGLDPNVLTDPNATKGTNSILPLCGDLTTEDKNNFSYMGDGSADCITESCPEYTLKYYESSTGNIISLTSRKQ